MAVNIYGATAEDGINMRELELYHLIMDYRASVGLPAIPLSSALSITAGRHALDTVENIGGFLVGEPGENKGHGWSDAPYDGRNSATYPNMWTAPQRLGTGYTASGFEISVGYLVPNTGTATMTAQTALTSWQGSAGHNAVIVNQAPWNQFTWTAIGIGMYKGVAHVWFGAAADIAGPAISGTADGETIVASSANETITGGLGRDTLTGGAGVDVFRDTAAGLSGDIITDFTTADRIVFSDANLANFVFALNGTTLTYTGGSLTLQNLPTGVRLVASAVASGGVELALLAPAVANDFNGDGRSDILWRHDSGVVSSWAGAPNGSFTTSAASIIAGVDQAWQIVGTGDFNGDGRSDILWRHTSGAVSSWFGAANGSFATSAASIISGVDQTWQVVGTGDFNGDGRSDILWRHTSGIVSDWLSTANGGFTSNPASIISGVDQAWHVAGTGDFNGDGRGDILWRHDSGLVSDWLGTANGSFANNAASVVAGVDQTWHVVGAGDFNGDGRCDILWRNDNGTVSDWLGAANGSFTSSAASIILGVDRSWHVVDTGDFNGDGRSDILWRNDNGIVSDWLGNADGGFTSNPASVITGIGQAWHAQSPDFVIF